MQKNKMGDELKVHLIYGYKLSLSEAFDLKLLNPVILKEGIWKLVHEPEHRDKLLTTKLFSPYLVNFLNMAKDWNIYILSSAQDNHDLKKSYMFLYDIREVLCSEKSFATGEVYMPLFSQYRELIPIMLPKEYGVHWVIENINKKE